VRGCVFNYSGMSLGRIRRTYGTARERDGRPTKRATFNTILTCDPEIECITIPDPLFNSSDPGATYYKYISSSRCPYMCASCPLPSSRPGFSATDFGRREYFYCHRSSFYISYHRHLPHTSIQQRQSFPYEWSTVIVPLLCPCTHTHTWRQRCYSHMYGMSGCGTENVISRRILYFADDKRRKMYLSISETKIWFSTFVVFIVKRKCFQWESLDKNVLLYVLFMNRRKINCIKSLYQKIFLSDEKIISWIARGRGLNPFYFVHSPNHENYFHYVRFRQTYLIFQHFIPQTNI